MDSEPSEFWSIPIEELLKQLASTNKGLTELEAQNSLKIHGSNRFLQKKESSALNLMLSQFKSPIILLLLFSAVLSFYLSQGIQALIIVAILLISGVLGFWQEYTATDAVSRLLQMVQIKADVLRDGVRKEIPVDNVVPGDVAILKAGDIIPGDALILKSRDLFINEAALTGETYPTEKFAMSVPRDAPLNRRTNSLFMGTSV